MALFWHIFLIAERLQDNAELHYATRRAWHHLSTDLDKSQRVKVLDVNWRESDKGPRLQVFTAEGMIEYYLHDRQFYRRGPKGSAQPVAENIIGLTFSGQVEGLLTMSIRSSKGLSDYELLCHLSYGRYSHEVIRGFEAI